MVYCWFRVGSRPLLSWKSFQGERLSELLTTPNTFAVTGKWAALREIFTLLDQTPSRFFRSLNVPRTPKGTGPRRLENGPVFFGEA